jgi:hypothetical protein
MSMPKNYPEDSVVGILELECSNYAIPSGIVWFALAGQRVWPVCEDYEFKGKYMGYFMYKDTLDPSEMFGFEIPINPLAVKEALDQAVAGFQVAHGGIKV